MSIAPVREMVIGPLPLGVRHGHIPRMVSEPINPRALALLGERQSHPADWLPELNRFAPAGQAIAHDARIPFGSAHVDRFTLANGLRVLILEDPATPVASIHTWVGVGSRHEHERESGIAHLVEHLMFGDRESEHAYGVTIDAMGGQCNAFTTYDTTCFTTDVPAYNIHKVIRLEASRMKHLAITDADFAREVEIVQHERRTNLEDEPLGPAVELMQAQMFSTHAYGRHTLGNKVTVQSLRIEDVRRFHREHYRPNNMVLAVVGGIDTRSVLSEIQASFGELEACAIPVEFVRPEVPMENEQQFVVKAQSSPRLWLGYLVPHIGDRADRLPMMLLDQILFDGRVGRVYRQMVPHIAAEVSSQLVCHAHHGGYMIECVPSESATLDETLSAFDACIREVKQNPISDEELAAAIAKTELQILSNLEMCSERAGAIGYCEIMLGNPAAILEDVTAARYVRPGDILRVARRYLRTQGRVVMKIQKGQK